MTRISQWPVPGVLSECNTEERLLEGTGGYKGWRVPREASGPVALKLGHMSASSGN